MATIPSQPPLSGFDFSDTSTSYSFFNVTSLAFRSLPSPPLTAASSSHSASPPPPPPSLLQLSPGAESQSVPPVSIQQFVHEKQCGQNLPPILYRAYNDGTKGLNSKDEKEGFKSERMKLTAKRVLLEDMTREEFRDSVVNHINNVMWFEEAGYDAPGGKQKKNKKKKPKVPKKPRRVSMQSIWLSTSSSLLTTLQRARWQVERGFKNVTIAAIDTGSLRKPEFAKTAEFICSVPELCEYLKHIETRRYIDFNCNEEYLVLNQIQCKISHIPFEELWNGGIRDILPALEDVRVKQHIGEGLRVLREATFRSESPLSAEEVEQCRQLTKFFFSGQRCNLIFYSLLALKRRPRNDPAIDGMVKKMMQGWRDRAAFHGNGQLKIDNIYQFRFEFDFTRPHQSSHEEIVQMAEIGQRLTRHNLAYERVIGKRIMEKIWDEYGGGVSQLYARFHIDRSARPLMEQLERTKRELSLWTFEQLCANENVRRRVVNDVKLLRKWIADVERNKPTSAGVTKARLERMDKKPAAMPAVDW